MTDPTTRDEWIEVAVKRGSDAEAIHKSEPDSIGCVYLAGYIIECSLKAYIVAARKVVPKTHNLGELMKKASLRPSDLVLTDSNKTFFFSYWIPDFRYQRVLQSDYNTKELLRAAKSVGSYIQKLAAREK